MGVYLASHALRRGYSATMYTYNLRVFDPTWFGLERHEVIRRLQARHDFVRSAKLQRAIKGYVELLELGGDVRLDDLTSRLVQSYLNAGKPILAGLSSTYLYRCSREYGPKAEYDDVRGDAIGHFVVLYGYDKKTREVLIADPLHPNPFAQESYYAVNIDRVLCAILLGVLTYDANVLIIEPANPSAN